ncbi:Anti-silencing protein, putative [Pediculus humanus corporis]|uniref:Anti-silencing protein, putative n=1 Tax=Pediculus humanus subsp. corporis TaxID=121224 RepID=E0VXU6_PEDHC|nr:Anti-silencing protein, putative [Pediculus humanus corporis]EEB18202.1 Anti-silencing protein, putative [Pediculus humanus corporis]
MAKVNIVNIVVLDNPSPFLNPFQFEITFDCIEELKEDLEWKMIYVGSAESEAYDQVLDTIYVGPIPEGRHMFVFQADPPDVSKIPVADVLGVTVVLLTCCYRSQEFVRVGYYTNNEYSDVELRENPPMQPQFDKIIRNILGSQPRVTRFKINWEDGVENKESVETELPDMADTCSTASPVKSVAQPESEWCTENSQNSGLINI